MSMALENERMLYAAKLILTLAGCDVQRTNLIKALFYLDLLWLRDTGKTYTGEAYVALPQGPVVDGYKVRLIEPLLADPDVVEKSVRLFPNATAKMLRMSADAPMPDDEHLEITARRVVERVAGQRAVDVSELTHENVAWLTAIRKGNGTPINMVLALQQVIDDDPWLDAAQTVDERACVEAALTQETRPF